MKLVPRRESVIAVVLTTCTVVVAVFWVMSYWYAFSIGWTRFREGPARWERTFWGLYVQEGQVGAGRSWTRADSAQLVSTQLAHKDWEDEYEFIFRAHTSPYSLWMYHHGRRRPDNFLGRIGFEGVNSTGSWPGSVVKDQAVLVPWWAVFTLSLIVTLRWTFFRDRRLHWGKVGRCAACGYDLRESRGRCPECGQVIGTAPGEGQAAGDGSSAIVPARENRENL